MLPMPFVNTPPENPRQRFSPEPKAKPASPVLDDEAAFEAAMAERFEQEDEDTDRSEREAALQADLAAERATLPIATPPPVTVPPSSPSSVPSAGQDRLAAFKKLSVQLNVIDMGTVLAALGATSAPTGKGQWALPDGRLLQHWPKTHAYKDLSTGKVGRDIVGLTAFVQNVKPGRAAHWLEEKFMTNGAVRADVPLAAGPSAAPSARSAAPVSAAPSPSASDRFEAFRNRIAPLETIEIEAILKALDGVPGEGDEPWVLPNGHQIQAWSNSQAFKNVTLGKGGRGGMALVGQVLGVRPGEAAAWLEGKFVENGQIKAGVPIAGAGGSAYANMTEEEALEAFIKRCEPLEAIDVDEVIMALGGRKSHDDKTKWKMPNGNNIWHKRYTQIWKDLTEDKGGSSVVQLTAQYLKIRQGEAARWLEARFTEDGKLKEGVELADLDSDPDDHVRGFELPAKSSEHEADVRRYLVADRGLPPSLIEAEFQQGRLYATYRADRKVLEHIYPHLSEEEREALPYTQVPRVAHCVFSSSNGAELRSVEKHGFKGTATGTDPNTAGYRVRRIDEVKEPILALTEAAISGLAYRSFFPGRFTFSTNGVARFSLQLYLVCEAMNEWDKVEYAGKPTTYGARIAFDADIPGDRGAQRLFNAIYVMHMVAQQRRQARLGPLAAAQGMSVGAYRKSLSPAEASAEDDAFFQDIFDVEDAFHNDSLSVKPGTSPHELFWGMGLGPQDNLEIHEKPEGSHVKENEDWTNTGRTSPPVIELEVNRPAAGFEKGRHTLKVTKPAYDYITHELNFRRDRPPLDNDWDDELLLAGPAYVRAYEEAAASKFAHGNPVLPEALAHLRANPPRYHVPEGPKPTVPRGSRSPR